MDSKNTEQIAENKMGVMPVKKLVWNMSFPMMVSMLVQALYNIVDSIFVARLSEDALTAVSLAFPLQTLVIAVGAGTGVGVNAILSRSLGEKNFEKANATALNGGFLYIMSYLLFLVLGFVAVEPFYVSQLGGSSPEIFDMGVQYLRIVMIFGLLGMPKMGVAGAAIATVIGQCVAAAVAFVCNVRYNHEIDLSLKGFRLSGALIGDIYMVGIPSIIMQSIGSVMTYCMNKILIDFSSTATAVFGVYFKLQSFFFMPVFGLNNGITPIIAYSYGAQQRKRMVGTIKYSMRIAFGLLFLGFAGFELVPQVLLKMFDASQEMMVIGCQALKVIGFHFLIAWFCIIAGTVFQALGRAIYSMIVSIMRQLVVLVPAAYILARLGGLHAVWWAFPIAELMSLMVSSVCLMNIYKKVIKPLPEGRD